jgi:hypothetical protein
MKPYARIKTHHSTVSIRFERVGSPSRFDCVLDLFRKAFPLAMWDHYARSWVLPISQLDTLVKFCRSLGYTCVNSQEQDTITTQKSQQQNLPL